MMLAMKQGKANTATNPAARSRPSLTARPREMNIDDVCRDVRERFPVIMARLAE